MPQLPTNTAEEYGADDEVKEYRQEDDDGSENSTVDVVNDIKSDLLKNDAEDQSPSVDDSVSLKFQKIIGLFRIISKNLIIIRYKYLDFY